MKLLVLAIVGLVACKGGDKAAPSPTGSATTPPPPPQPAAPATPPAPAPPAASFTQNITADGIGPVTTASDPKAIASLFPGLEAKTEHADREGHSIDETVLSLPGGPPVLHVVVDNMLSDTQVSRVDAVGSMFATSGGIRVGSTVADLVAKFPDAECKRETYTRNAENIGSALFCETASLAHVSFHLDPAALEGSDGKVLAARIASLKLTRITWRPKLVAQAAGDAGGQPFCFEPNTELAIDRLVATDDDATFCGGVNGKLTCVTASFATGAFTGTAGAVPPPTVVDPPARVSSDGSHKLVKTGKGLSLVDAKTGKDGVALAVGEGEFKCIDNGRFLGADIYATASLCNQPRSIGYVFSPTGERIGDKLDGINLQDAKPFHMRGDRWAFHSADSESVLIIDVANGEQGTVDLLTPDQVSHCCDVTVHATIPPFTLTPKGKLVSVGGALAVIDLATGKAEHAWPLPGCKH